METGINNRIVCVKIKYRSLRSSNVSVAKCTSTAQTQVRTAGDSWCSILVESDACIIEEMKRVVGLFGLKAREINGRNASRERVENVEATQIVGVVSWEVERVYVTVSCRVVGRARRHTACRRWPSSC